MMAAAGAVSACHEPPTEPSPPQPCSVSLDPSNLTFTSAGGTGVVAISTSRPDCGWTATASASWIEFRTATTGTGAGSITYFVAANAATQARTATLGVGGKTHAISQDGAEPPGPVCTYVVAPVNAEFDSTGGQGTINVSVQPSCAWTASTSDSWLTVTNGASRQGEGSVTYTVAKRTSSDPRTGVLHVAGVDVRVGQSGDATLCEYSVTPVTFNPCMPAISMTASVVTGASCPWTAASNVAWVTITVGQAGTGSGVISFATSENYDAPRTGVVQVRWPAPTQGQNLQVAQAGCSYAVSQNSLSFPAAGGSASFDVYQSSDPNTCGGALQDACVWTAVPDSSWIVVSPSGAIRGDNTVHVVVPANGTGASRTGAIRIRDKIVVVTQSGS